MAVEVTQQLELSESTLGQDTLVKDLVNLLDGNVNAGS